MGYFLAASVAWRLSGSVPQDYYALLPHLALPPALEVKALTRAEHVLTTELSKIQEVVGIYTQRDCDGVLMAFAVANKHEEATYRLVINAEARIAAQLSNDMPEIRIRATHNRPMSDVVPVTSDPIFVR